MKNIYSAIAVAFAIVLSAACTKTDAGQKPSENGPYEITIIGEMGGFDISTKSSVESVVRMKWNTTTTDDEKDVVWVYGYDNTKSEFVSLSTNGLKATSTTANPYTATLSGTIDAIPSDGYLYLVHCPSGSNYTKPDITTSENTGSISIDMSAVAQEAGVTPFIIYSSVKVTETKLSGLTANFSFATSIVKVNLTGLGASVGLTSAAVSNLNKNCSLSFSGGAVIVTAAPETPTADDLGTFTKNLSSSATASGKATFLLAVPAMSANTGRVLTISASGNKTYTDSGVFPGKHAASAYINTICCVEEQISTGVFSISDTKRVKFTKGNLWWGSKDSEAAAFHFEANQYDYRTWEGSYSCIGGDVSTTGTPSGNVGLFFFTTTAEKSYAEIYSEAKDPGYFFANGDTTSIETAPVERRTIIVDGQSGCYLLSLKDLAYMFMNRTCENRYAKAKINNINGLLLFPDSYSGTTSGTGISDVNSAAVDYPKASIPDDTWTAMDEAGCVFLPVVGRRQYYESATHVFYSTTDAYYWTSTHYDSERAKYFVFHDSYISAGGTNKSSGMPLRLVYDVN